MPKFLITFRGTGLREELHSLLPYLVSATDSRGFYPTKLLEIEVKLTDEEVERMRSQIRSLPAVTDLDWKQKIVSMYLRMSNIPPVATRHFLRELVNVREIKELTEAEMAETNSGGAIGWDGEV